MRVCVCVRVCVRACVYVCPHAHMWCILYYNIYVLQGYDDPQTEADRRVERCIVATLTSRFPNITVIGEEVRRGGGAERRRKRRRRSGRGVEEGRRMR